MYVRVCEVAEMCIKYGLKKILEYMFETTTWGKIITNDLEGKEEYI